MGTCSRRLGGLAAGLGLPATHQMMTGGRPPVGIRPVERPARQEETRLDLEVEEEQP